MSTVRSTLRKGASAGAIAAGAGLGLIAYGIHGRTAQVFGPSSWRGPGVRRSIALSFDDGPSPGSLRLIEYLAEQNIKATFFQCGMNVLRHPEIARLIGAQGHELGNHTFSHRRLSPRLGWQLNLLSAAEIYKEFARAQAIITAETGFTPRLLRAPYGLRWFGLAATQRKLNLHGAMWTAMTKDWEWPAARIATELLKQTEPGDIFCLHDGRDIRANPDIGETLAAVRTIVPVLKDRGFSFETVSGILQR